MKAIEIKVRPHKLGELTHLNLIKDKIAPVLSELGYKLTLSDKDTGDLVFMQTDKTVTIYFFYDLKGNKQGSLNHYKMTQMCQGQPVQSCELSLLDTFDGFLHNSEWLG